MDSRDSRTSVSRRQFLVVAGGVLASSVLASALAACGGAAPASPPAAPAQGGSAPTSAPAAAPTTAPAAASSSGSSNGPISLAVAAGGMAVSWKQVWDLLIKTFQDKHPNITVSIDQGSVTGQYDQKLFAELAAGTLPDIIRTTDNYVEPFKQRKITQDMLPFARATKFPIDDFNKTFLDLGMVDGTLQMLPVSGDVVILIINKKMVQDAGVEIPWKLDPASSSWTQDEFYKVTQRLTVDAKGKRGDEPGFDKNNVDVYGFAIDPTWWAIYVPAILSQGGQFVSEDLTKSLLDSKEGVAAFEWLTRGVLEGFWTPLSLLNTVSGTAGAFTGGKAAITYTVRGGLPGIRPNMKDDWDACHFYRGPAKRITGMGTQGFALSGTTKHPNEAWSFLDFMYSEDGTKIITSQYGATPVEKRFYNASWWKDLPPPPANNDVFTQAYDYGTLPPRLPFYTTGPFTKAVTDGFTAIQLKQSTPSQVVQSVSNELQKWLDQNKKK